MIWTRHNCISVRYLKHQRESKWAAYHFCGQTNIWSLGETAKHTLTWFESTNTQRGSLGKWQCAFCVETERTSGLGDLLKVKLACLPVSVGQSTKLLLPFKEILMCYICPALRDPPSTYISESASMNHIKFLFQSFEIVFLQVYQSHVFFCCSVHSFDLMSYVVLRSYRN